jgi:peroxiredoxin Q/BCP
MAKLKVGDKAPDFTLPAQTGENITLSQFFGKNNIVLFFYPRDEGPTCVKEAEAFRDNFETFKNKNAQIIGISAQSVESHKNFACHHNLPYILLSDSDNSVRKLYSVASTMGVPGRVTFVINKEATVKHVYASQLQFTKHAKEALNALKD